MRSIMKLTTAALLGALLGLLLAAPGVVAQSSAVFISIARNALTSTNATVTTSRPLVDLTQTWNAGGVTFEAIKLAVTSTASAAASTVVDLKVGGSSVFKVDKLGVVTSAGAISGAALTDVVVFYPAVQFCKSDKPSAELLPTRLAKGDWALARTAAGAETYNIVCALHPPRGWRTTAAKGAKLDSFRISEQITVASLTSNTLNDLSTTTHVNNVANAVADYGGVVTYTPPTATQANPYLTAGSLGTAAFMVTVDAYVNLDFTVVMQNTGVYRLYGISATWTVQD
jgi:hypothetical protein